MAAFIEDINWLSAADRFLKIMCKSRLPLYNNSGPHRGCNFAEQAAVKYGKG